MLVLLVNTLGFLFLYSFKVDVRVSLDVQFAADQRRTESTTDHISLNYEKFSLMILDYLIQNTVGEVVQLHGIIIIISRAPMFGLGGGTSKSILPFHALAQRARHQPGRETR